MELGLNDKVIILTAGEKSISGCINILCGEGANIVILGENLLQKQLLQEEMIKFNDNLFILDTLLQDSDECDKAIRAVMHKYGRIDGLVNYSEFHSETFSGHSKTAGFAEWVQKDLSRYYLVTHFALPHIKITRGVIVNISFEPGDDEKHNPAFAAINGAINALTREWAVELLKYGIRVNSLIENMYAPEIGNAVAFLLSKKSSHTTGQWIRIGRQ